MLGVAAALATAQALAACGPRQVPSYGDISAVSYEKTECYGVCPSYAVSFSRSGFSYEGRANVARMGSYEAPEAGEFVEVIALLAKLDFYSMNVKRAYVTDVPHYIVSVERCGVTKRIDWPALVWPGVSGTHDIRDLFNGLDRITNSISWRRKGSR